MAPETDVAPPKVIRDDEQDVRPVGDVAKDAGDGGEKEQAKAANPAHCRRPGSLPDERLR